MPLLSFCKRTKVPRQRRRGLLLLIWIAASSTLLSCVVEAFVPSSPSLTKTTKRSSIPPTLSRSSFPLQSVRLARRRRRTPPLLRASSNNNDKDATTAAGGPVVNLSLVRQTVLNQGLIGITIWTGGAGAVALAERAHFDAGALVLALVGVLPLIAFSRAVETSENPAVSDLNVSTNMLVLRLFGDQSQPLVALVVSAALAGLTGLVEETTFRGQVLPQIAASTGGSTALAIAGSTIIFAVLHLNPLALVRGGLQGLVDGAVLIAYQLVTGTWFALLYVGTGNLAVSIVAHALFDFYVFFFTHVVVTQQMAYAAQQALMPSDTAAERRWRTERGQTFVTQAAETFYLADTNQDGVLSREELRIAMASYGVRLSAEQSATVTAAADMDASGTIDFGEFLDFVGPTGSPGKAIKNSLLGVNG